MSKHDIWMPIVIGDYLADTQRLSTEQHGAFLLLLMDYWRNGPPPADDAVLCSITRLKLARFRKHKTVLLSFFRIVDGRLIDKRADAEKIRAEQNAKRNSERARHAADVRWRSADGDAPSNAPSNAASNAPECPSPSPSVTSVTGGVAADPVKSLFDDGVALLVGKGASQGAARSLIGQLRKKAGDERLGLLIAEAQSLDITDPRAWLTAAANCPANDPLTGLMAAVSTHAARKAQAAVGPTSIGAQ